MIKGDKIKLFIRIGIMALALLLVLFIFVPEKKSQHMRNRDNYADGGVSKDSDLPIEPKNKSDKIADDTYGNTQNNKDLGFIDANVFKSVSEEWEQHDFKVPKLLVKMRFNGVVPLQKIEKLYDESSLPQFYEILKDENISGHELDMTVMYISLISKRGNKQTIKELLDFYKRSVNWDKWRNNETEIDEQVFAKWDALDWLGFIGGNDVEEVLKQAMTVDGGKELSKEWLADIPPTTFSVLDNLRGHAACGLAFSDKQEVHKLIKDEYEKERKACLDAGVTSGAYINQLITAMARIDIVKDIGLEAHRKLADDYLYQVYIRKYLLFEAGPPAEIKY